VIHQCFSVHGTPLFTPFILLYDDIKTLFWLNRLLPILLRIANRIMSHPHCFTQPASLNCSLPINDELSQTRPIQQDYYSQGSFESVNGLLFFLWRL